MQSFQKLTPDSMELVRPFFAAAEGRLCNHTLSYTMFWRDYLQTEYLLRDGALLLRSQPPDGSTSIFACPVGGDFSENIAYLRQLCREEDIPLRFYSVPASFLEALHGIGAEAQAVPCREFFDYLYDAEALAFFRGKRLAGQRNHCNRFQKLYPDWRFESLDEGNRAFAASLLEGWEPRSGDSVTAREELLKTGELLRDYERYNVIGGILFAEAGKPAAFYLGERVDDTFYVHSEKADPAFHGAHQMIVREGAHRAYGDGIRYINRGEDDGVEGLRTSKLSYHPVSLLEKYDVTLPA